MIVRGLGGLIGVAFFSFPFLLLLGSREVPVSLWLTSLPAFLMGLAFLGYAIGGQRLLARIAPSLSEKGSVAIKESSTGRRSVTIHDERRQVYTFFRDTGGDMYFAEGDETQVLEVAGTRVEHLTYPRGVLAMFLHGHQKRGDFKFIDERGKEWEIRGTSGEFEALVRLSSARIDEASKK